jgi:hypothetical protein
VHDELKPIRDEIDSWKPDVAFSLLEQFHGEVIYDQNVVGFQCRRSRCSPSTARFAVRHVLACR